MKKMFLVALGVVALLVGSIACAPAAPKITLPEGTIKLSDVVPAMGEHWANPAKLPLGPIYLVNKGNVIGLEYMWTEAMMKHMSIPTPAGLEEFHLLAELPVSATINHVDISFMPKGHEGFTEAHWDIHLYFITPAEKNAIKPGG